MSTDRCVESAGCVFKERAISHSRVIVAGGQAEEGLSALGRVLVEITAVRRRSYSESFRGRRKPQPDEHERDEDETPP